VRGNIVRRPSDFFLPQVGLVEILNSIGLKPDGLIGHSLGETACAYADGSLTLEQAVLASYERGAVSNETEMVKGMMAAIGKFTAPFLFYIFSLYQIYFIIPSCPLNLHCFVHHSKIYSKGSFLLCLCLTQRHSRENQKFSVASSLKPL
jgi:hypothetical protein